VQLTFSYITPDGVTVDYDSIVITSIVDEDGALKVREAKDFCDPEKRTKFHAEVMRLVGAPAT
jgi:hypothetical protein